MWYIAGFEISKSSIVYNVRYFAFKKLQIGANTIINRGVYIDNRRGVKIGNNVVIAHDTKIYTLGHDFEDENFVTKGKEVIIEDDVVIFANVLVMPGAILSKGTVVLPGAVITKKTEKMGVYGGNPAKLLRIRKRCHKPRRLNYFYNAN